MRAWALLAAAALVACSSSGGSSGGTSSSSSSGGSSSGTSGGGGGGGNNCSCMITFNDVSGSANCGESTCVNGEQFSCASDGSGATDEGACKTTQSDAGGGGSSCSKLGSNNCEKDSDCCSGLSCYSTGCYTTTGGACTASDQCEPDHYPFVGQTCGSAQTCCEKTNYACAQQGPDPYCCSGTCGAPNQNGISFCL